MVIWVLEWMNMPLRTGIICAVNALVLLDQCVCHCTILLVVIDIFRLISFSLLCDFFESKTQQIFHGDG